MAGPYPGKRAEEEAIWSLTELTDSGVNHFVDLTFLKGESTDMLEPYAHLLDDLPNGSHPGYSRHSIVDLDVPSPDLMRQILSEIESTVSRGEVVYVHCWGGVGRTGTVVACHLVNSGLSTDEALARIPELRAGLIREHRRSPEMSEQEDFVRAWEPDSDPR